MKGWRTLAVNAALALVGVAEAADWTNLLGEGAAGYVVMAIGVANMLLRAMTNTPVGAKE